MVFVGPIVGTLIFLLLDSGGINGMLIFCIVVAACDIIVALGMEAIAPAKVILGPGDRTENNSPVRERARILSEIAQNGACKVQVRGETWDARCNGHSSKTVSTGEEVKIVGREGLTLIIEVGAGDT